MDSQKISPTLLKYITEMNKEQKTGMGVVIGIIVLIIVLCCSSSSIGSLIYAFYPKEENKEKKV